VAHSLNQDVKKDFYLKTNAKNDSNKAKKLLSQVKMFNVKSVLAPWLGV
jgi:hypothetical protein